MNQYTCNGFWCGSGCGSQCGQCNPCGCCCESCCNGCATNSACEACSSCRCGLTASSLSVLDVCPTQNSCGGCGCG